MLAAKVVEARPHPRDSMRGSAGDLQDHDGRAVAREPVVALGRAIPSTSEELSTQERTHGVRHRDTGENARKRSVVSEPRPEFLNLKHGRLGDPVRETSGAAGFRAVVTPGPFP